MYRVFPRDVTAAMSVSLNKGTAPYWPYPQLILWELNSIVMQSLSFVLL